MNTLLRSTLVAGALALCVSQAQAALNCSITRQGDTVVIAWPSESGRTYALSRSDQSTGHWRVLSLQTAAAVDRPFRGFFHHEKVDIAVRRGIASRTRPEQDDALRIVAFHNASDYLIQ